MDLWDSHHKAKDRGIREKRQNVFSDFESETERWSGEPDLSRFRPRGEGAWSAAFSQQLRDDHRLLRPLAQKYDDSAAFPRVSLRFFTLPIILAIMSLSKGPC